MVRAVRLTLPCRYTRGGKLEDSGRSLQKEPLRSQPFVFALIFAKDFALGLRAALREDSDVILVGEMRDLETISTALIPAETGHLVFATWAGSGAITPLA